MKKTYVVLGWILAAPPAFALTIGGNGTEQGCECPDGKMVAVGALCSNGTKCTNASIGGGGGDIPSIQTCSALTCKGTDWERISSAYQHRVIAWCNDADTCIKTDEYRCANMYYGTSTDGKTGCQFCPPTYNSATAHSVPGENQEKTDCYSPKGNFEDNTGSGIFNDDCYYVE